MRRISNSTGSDSGSEKSSDFGFAESDASSKQFYQELIAKANSVSLKSLFKIYGVYLDEHNRKCICPFPAHQDDSPSFIFYPETNSFFCFGCKTGTRPVNFVANMDDVSKVKAAFKILDLFDSETDFNNPGSKLTNHPEKLEILIGFSDMIRETINSQPDNQGLLEHVEKISAIFDKLNNKYDLDNLALKALVAKLKDKLSSYTF